MKLTILFGILLIATGAFAAGSFAVPFGKIKGWKWETYWLIFSLGAYILFPLFACLIFVPGFGSIIKSSPSSAILSAFLLGAVYGIGNLSFGLALRYLGLSLGYALSLGLMLAIGTLIPPMISGRLQVMMNASGGTLLISGVFVACIGIALSAWSGIRKDKILSEEKKKQSIGEFNLVKGIMAAILVGIAGSAMALGFEKALPINELAAQKGISPLFTILPVMLVILAGTFSTTLGWCIFLGIKNKSLREYKASGSGMILFKNYMFGLLAGLLWFSQFIVYGMGQSKMGPYSFTSWGILMALTIAFATVWGLLRNEWKGVSRGVFVLMILSLIIIIVSSFMIGISGSV